MPDKNSRATAAQPSSSLPWQQQQQKQQKQNQKQQQPPVSSVAIVTPLLGMLLERFGVASDRFRVVEVNVRAAVPTGARSGREQPHAPAGDDGVDFAPGKRVRHVPLSQWCEGRGEGRLEVGMLVRLGNKDGTGKGNDNNRSEYLLVERVSPTNATGGEERLEGTVVVGMSKTCAAVPGIDSNRLFLTGQKNTGKASEVQDVALPGSYVLQHFHGQASAEFVAQAHSASLCPASPHQPWTVDMDKASLSLGMPRISMRRFHLGDFLYARPKAAKGELLHIIQLKQLQPQHRIAIFAQFKRAADQKADLSSAKFVDNQQLLPLAKAPAGQLIITKAQLENGDWLLLGQCWVEEVQKAAKLALRGKPHTFYINASNSEKEVQPFERCVRCTEVHKKRNDVRHAITKRNLSALELFAGCGGSTIGLALAGGIKTRWAVELDDWAARTFERHHPGVRVVQRDVGAVLEEMASGAQVERMPRPGEKLDLLMAGPPCQGFSKLNASRRRADDPRNLLIATTLSFVDVLRPKFAIIENVGGMLEPEHGRLGNVKHGASKFIMRAFLAMRYSFRFGFLQAAAFGAPQSRLRAIILAARADVDLPAWPMPTHASKAKQRTLNLLDTQQQRMHPFFVDPWAQCGGLPEVTARDALSDLAEWDWQDPHSFYQLRNDTWEAQKRIRQLQHRIPALPTSSTAPAGPSSPCQYRTPPLTAYQHACRIHDHGMMQLVTQHQTPAVDEATAERVVNVPLRAGANWQDWCSGGEVDKPLLLPPMLSTGQQGGLGCFFGSGSSSNGIATSYDDAYSRGSADAAMRISLTSAHAGSKNGGVLHPWQHRVLSVREAARSQGFPDAVEFATGPELSEAQRQIGNAVPIPLARALGRAIIDSLVDAELRAMEDGHPRRAMEDGHPRRAMEDGQPCRAMEDSQPRRAMEDSQPRRRQRDADFEVVRVKCRRE